MTELSHPVLIGDDNETRATWLGQFLYNNHGVKCLWASTFDKICALAKTSRRAVVFLADTLPLTDFNDLRAPQSFFDQLRGVDPRVNRVYVRTEDSSPTVLGQISIRLPWPKPDRAAGNQILEALKPLQDVLPLADATIDEIDKLTKWPKQDRTLREQIRSLSREQNLKAGEQQLFDIIRNCFDCRKIEKIQLASLIQGKSGARVFHLMVTAKKGAQEREGASQRTRAYVLKLSKAQDIWKLQSEVNGYLKAKASELYNPYKGHIPVLQTPRRSKSAAEIQSLHERRAKASAENLPVPEEFIANSLSWPAIYYDFLGGSLGEFMTLSTALVAAPDRLRTQLSGKARANFILADNTPAAVMDFRVNFLKTLLAALSNLLYLNERHTCRKIKQLWKGGNAPDREYVPLPPYQLAARTREWLQEFLDSDEAKIGGRLLPGWNDCCEAVLALARSTAAKTFGSLNEKFPVILSPVHGDLNANNVFLWLEQPNFPFLIDLPFYQDAGHALQDFARLETEIKFALMDRQEESPPERLAAYDYSVVQMPLWQELEDHLLHHHTAGADEPVWRAGGFHDNVRLTYRLVQVIRATAEQVQQQHCARSTLRPIAFMDEYLPALLYPTLRAITYPSLSPFKRMLAVYSAGSILNKCVEAGR